MIKMHKKAWKPQKLANDKAGEIIDWTTRLANPEEWLLSFKYDGNRVEAYDGIAFSRELNKIKSVQVQDMTQKIWEKYQHQGFIEAEFYSPDMTFAEIQHFFKTEDVTSDKTKKKYTSLWKRTQGIGDKWKFPGRSVEWLTTWHDSLKLYIFDQVLNDDTRTKEERYHGLYNSFVNSDFITSSMLIIQHELRTLAQVYKAYDQVIASGGEGLVVMKKKSLYKPGRITLKENVGYKIKDSNVEFWGKIISVEEGTIARVGSVKTISKLGSSKTSQLKEDRIPSGIAKGFLVTMDDGRTLTVPISGFNHAERKLLLIHPGPWIGKRIKFTGMNPVKEGGKPRSSHYVKEAI